MSKPAARNCGRLPSAGSCRWHSPVIVPYTDPGVPLARETRARIIRYIDEHNELPRIILIQNHGLIVLGKTAQQVEDTTAMAVKAARILLGTFAAGGPHFLSAKDVARIHTRPDELYRRQKLGVQANPALMTVQEHASWDARIKGRRRVRADIRSSPVACASSRAAMKCCCCAGDRTSGCGPAATTASASTSRPARMSIRPRCAKSGRKPG
ncbi:MAG: hypothetical protein FJ011_21210 [Chloroflexi bacterium]|nr:hypothetical protein [Chloroflexota bacterium]